MGWKREDRADLGWAENNFAEDVDIYIKRDMVSRAVAMSAITIMYYIISVVIGQDIVGNMDGLLKIGV